MIRYSANYIYTNNDFVIQNVKTRNISKKHYPIICIMKNLLQRGNPTKCSKFLEDKLGVIDLVNDREKIYFMDREKPSWINIIKGDDENNYFPARDFLYNKIPKYLGDYEFIQQLILPECKISDITDKEEKEFIDQQVDFYLPQAKLVIEIDGNQHKDTAIKKNDDARDEYLEKNGIITVRINTFDLEKESDVFKNKINSIRHRCDEYNKKLEPYLKCYLEEERYRENYKYNIKLKASAVIRFQLTILSLLEANVINLDDEKWNIEILQRDIDNFEELAIEDLFLWFENLCKLSKIKFNKPQVNIVDCKSYDDFHYNEETIHIDFSLFKRWTDENQIYKQIIFVRTDYLDDIDYFKISTSDPIQYNIKQDGKESDISSLKFFLKNIFDYDSFATGQLPIIINALSGNDTIGLLPTGGGKSLCYQFIALLQPCVNFVVVPIKSLMYDQKENIDKKFINRTNFVSSDQSAEEKKRICSDFSKGKYFFIWISPERFQTKEFREYLTTLNEEQTIALAIIDEVHCLSEWGHDFRTSYLNLCKTIIKYCPSTIFLGLTATASINVLKDILVEFGIGRENVKTILEYTRPELHFKVLCDGGENTEGKYKTLVGLLEKLNEQRDVFNIDNENTKSGLIFTVVKNGPMGCYGLYKKLCIKYPNSIKWYSGEIPEETTYNNGFKSKRAVIKKDEFDKYKQKVQREYKENKFPLLLATKAFGMGIDKSNIRYTIHYGIPGSLESLYQEAGRAGRDKKNAACYILYSKEVLDNSNINKLFELNTTIDEIKDINSKCGFKDGRDILRNFFLWVQNNKGVDFETVFTYEVFKEFAEANTIKTINCKDVLNSCKKYDKCNEVNKGNVFGLTQKAIYRLSLLGIVEDWVIEKWSVNGSFKVNFTPFNLERVKDSLLLYIRKYDLEFNLFNVKRNSKYIKYQEILNNYDCDEYENIIKLLIQWNYDNVFYNRRQSLKTLVDLCESFNAGKEEEFKKSIESYFKFTESTYVLEHISQNPKDFQRWFDIFRKENGDMLDKNEIKNLKAGISRFLESFRYNTGLNFVSGVIRLILDDFNNTDGRERLDSAFQQITNFDEEEQKSILSNSLQIAGLLDEKNKYYLSESLCKYYKNNIVDIYKALQDNNSLNLILEESVQKLEKLGGNLL